MFLSFCILLLLAFGSLPLTYIYDQRSRFMQRLAAGAIIGSVICGTAAFLISCLFGLSAVTAVVSVGIDVAPLLLLRKEDIGKRFKTDWANAKNRVFTFSVKNLPAVLFYLGLFILFVLFFEKAMFETGGAIFTGGSNNLGDLPYHLGAIFSFTEINNFPPVNPSYAEAKFSYPFIADLLTAVFMKFGVDVASVMIAQNVAWAFSLVVLLQRFCLSMIDNKLAARLAVFLLIFSGGMGFVWFFGDASAQGLSVVLDKLPQDYTVKMPQFYWANAMTSLFMTQRSLLLGLPLTLVVLTRLWEWFSAEPEENAAISNIYQAAFVGLLGGLLVLVHLHSLFVLFIVGVFLMFFKPVDFKIWLAFAAGVAVVAVPELIWSISGSASRTTEFIAWHIGWTAQQENYLWFWLKNTWLTIPLLIAGFVLLFLNTRKSVNADEDTENAPPPENKDKKRLITLASFYFPFAILFVICNVAKLAPWDWDNIKVLIYWYIGSLPFIAFALAWIWQKNTAGTVVACVLFASMIFSGALDVYRTIDGQVNFQVFDRDGVAIAEQIKLRTPKDTIFLNAPTYNSPVVLSGRQSLIRYLGHLSSHGIDPTERDRDLRVIYSGGGTADVLLQKHNIGYVIIGPQEIIDLKPNVTYFAKFPVIANSGSYTVYKVK